MKKSFLAIIFLILTNSSLIYSQKSLNIKSSVSQYDFYLTLTDSVKLDCTKFIPDGPRPKKGWPVIVYCHGYADSKEVMLDNARAQAAYGYYTFAFSMRGQGKSGGLSNLISTLEMYDLMQVIQYIKKDSAVNKDRIALFGGSQGGILPFMAACYGTDIRCILSDLASPEFATSWIENGCVKITLFFSVDYDSTGARYNKNVKDIRKWILSKNVDDWDSLALHLPKNRDFLDRVKDCKVPILTTNAWQDKFFNASGMMKASQLLTVPYRMYFGTINGHGSDSSFAEDKFISKFDDTWIEYWLNDIPNGIVDSTKFYFASSHYPVLKDEWLFSRFNSPVWLPEKITPFKLYFHPGNKLETFQNTTNIDTVSFMNEVRDSTLTMQQAINYEFKGVVFNLRFGKRLIYFDSDPLPQDVQLVGIPKIDLHYSSTADVCQYNFQLWEVKPTKESHFVSRINYTDRHYVPNEIRDKEIDGLAYSHIFRKGNRLRIIVTNLDTEQADSFLVSNPHVLPVLKRAKNTIYMNSASPSSIELPLLNYNPVLLVQDIIPIERVTLHQNYPNPVSISSVNGSSTTINYSLAKHEHVKLSIFDMLGRDIKNLIDNETDEGEHAIQFNPDTQLPAGMYYYRLTTPTISITKSMMLIK